MRESWDRMVEAKGKGGREEVMELRFSRMSFTTVQGGVRGGGLGGDEMDEERGREEGCGLVWSGAREQSMVWKLTGRTYEDG